MVPDMPDESPKPDESSDTPKPVSGKTTLLGCLVLLVVAFAGCSALAAFGNNSDVSHEVDAKVYCEEYVKEALKSPSTADFSGEVATQGGDSDTYTVTGSVDSQNSFGATIRNTFTCGVHKSGDTWRLVSLTGLSN